MAESYIGEIRAVGFTFAPVGWLMCDGSTVPIAGNEALYALIGTTYGGDGATSFKLPDLRGRGVMHTGSGYPMGSGAGVESVLLTGSQNGLHVHPIAAQSGPGTVQSPANAYLASSTVTQFGTAPTETTGTMLTVMGAGQPHENRMPSMAMNYIIATTGAYPSAG